jgi:hypothetical protein
VSTSYPGRQQLQARPAGEIVIYSRCQVTGQCNDVERACRCAAAEQSLRINGRNGTTSDRSPASVQQACNAG